LTQKFIEKEIVDLTKKREEIYLKYQNLQPSEPKPKVSLEQIEKAVKEKEKK
jgi:hypothetical protein